MSSDPNPLSKPYAATAVNAAGTKYSYSRKRACGFDTWQEHLRQVEDPVNCTLSARFERGLPRDLIAG